MTHTDTLPRHALLASGLCGIACFVLVGGLLLEYTALATAAKLVASTAFLVAALAAGARSPS